MISRFYYHILSVFVLLPAFLLGEGIVIILNGPSAAGKTSIQNELQKKSKQFYLKVGIDTFFDALLPAPDLSAFEKTKELSQYTNDGILIRQVRLKIDKEGHQIVPLTIGPAGDLVIHGMHAAIEAYAQQGNNLVVDYILYKPEWLANLVNALKNNKTVYFIGIKAPLHVLEEREKKRATSPVGHARSHYNTVHTNMVYDLELDVSALTPEQSAAKIQQFIENNPSPTALMTMKKRQETAF